MKLFMTKEEQGYLKENHPKLHAALKDKLAIFEPAPHTQLLDDLNESLGAKVSEYGYGVAQSSDLSGLRDLGQRPATVYFDEAHNLSEIYDSGEPSVITQKWMEHRRICRRALLECLSGESH